MQIIVLGDDKRIAEFKEKIGDKAEILIVKSAQEAAKKAGAGAAIFDLNLDDNPDNLQQYMGLNGTVVVGCAVKKQLAAMVNEAGGEISCKLFGMNALPEFINRALTEISFYNSYEKDNLTSLTSNIGWEVSFVEDRVGMVTPRVIFMIINEACYTLQEGTAGMDDIDHAMKLGTNYPNGPFEWADKIGVAEVYETLNAIYLDTRDERYKICPLLKTKFLRGESFR